MEEVDGVAEYRDRLLALPCIKDTSYPRSLPIDKYADDDIYIMVKCLSVTFLLISFSPISGHFWV